MDVGLPLTLRETFIGERMGQGGGLVTIGFRNDGSRIWNGDLAERAGSTALRVWGSDLCSGVRLLLHWGQTPSALGSDSYRIGGDSLCIGVRLLLQKESDPVSQISSARSESAPSYRSPFQDPRPVARDT